jgi:simple sugar transport system substrate-binding protein
MDQATPEQKTSLEVSRRTALTMAAKLGLGGAALTAALRAGDVPAALAAGRGETLPRHNYSFVFVNHVTTNPFFTPTQYGAADASQLLGCHYRWTGSAKSIVSEMVQAFQTAIASRADGIAVSIIDPHAFNAPVASALAAGIPVVAYNADAPASSNNKRMAYIGQDLFLSGQQMGKRIVAHVAPGSHIGLFIATPGSLNIQPRIDGAVDSIKKSGKKITYDVIATGALLTDERARVESYYLGHKSVKGLFAVDGGSTQSVAQVSAKYGLQKRGVYTGGYDLLPGTISGIESGDMGFTIDQQPYLQGFYPVVQLFLYKLSGTLMFPSPTDTGLKFVTKENIKPYLTKSRFEGTSTTV